MKVIAITLILLLLTVAVAADSDDFSGPVLPPDPHQSINEEGTCANCHDYYLGEVDPHEFIVDVTEDCLKEGCHQEMGNRMVRMHPLDRDISRLDFEIPEDMPLDQERMSCGTCHQPHKEWLSRIKSAPWEEPSFYLEKSLGDDVAYIPYYKTHYLRIFDPMFGYKNLCTTCHPGI